MIETIIRQPTCDLGLAIKDKKEAKYWTAYGQLTEASTPGISARGRSRS